MLILLLLLLQLLLLLRRRRRRSVSSLCSGLHRYGDMRVMMAYELFSMWQKLGEMKLPPFGSS